MINFHLTSRFIAILQACGGSSQGVKNIRQKTHDKLAKTEVIICGAFPCGPSRTQLVWPSSKNGSAKHVSSIVMSTFFPVNVTTLTQLCFHLAFQNRDTFLNKPLNEWVRFLKDPWKESVPHHAMVE